MAHSRERAHPPLIRGVRPLNLAREDEERTMLESTSEQSSRRSSFHLILDRSEGLSWYEELLAPTNEREAFDGGRYDTHY